jgi:adenine-specific DNA-methyltransferase
MLEFKDDLIKREDKGDHWTNLRNCAFEKEFVSEKIIWLEISDRGNFTIDSDGMYLNNSAYFISGHSLKYLVAVLNSKLCDFYFFQKTAVIAGGRKRYTKQYVEQNPIPIITEKEQQPFIDKVDQILTLKKDNPAADTSALEREIDVMVYALYGLTEEEIKIVEGS